ncbi:hypothetical protein BDV98DRAFT_575669 [Pterulicium gracile]|uniref:Uncharacterized protein n=1 Tax=Pterulicium gracile TaxID=1884261 RepID=A0A5C3Q6M9_9AGAR|nr:hypothetical protein BDV98DRAFT_575669 [Pterula gracilis]
MLPNSTPSIIPMRPPLEEELTGGVDVDIDISLWLAPWHITTSTLLPLRASFAPTSHPLCDAKHMSNLHGVQTLLGSRVERSPSWHGARRRDGGSLTSSVSIQTLCFLDSTFHHAVFPFSLSFFPEHCLLRFTEARRRPYQSLEMRASIVVTTIYSHLWRSHLPRWSLSHGVPQAHLKSTLNLPPSLTPRSLIRVNLPLAWALDRYHDLSVQRRT